MFQLSKNKKDGIIFHLKIFIFTSLRNQACHLSVIIFVDDDTEATALAEKVRVLCWVMTSPQNLDKKSSARKKHVGKAM